MKLGLVLLTLLLAAGPARAQDKELTAYSVAEIEGLLQTFKQTYKNRKTPEEDAISALADLKKAYRYIAWKGDDATKEEQKAQQKIVTLVARKGLFVKKRPLVALECARVLGEIGDPDAGPDLRKWMERILDEKAVNTQWVEYGFQSLAWIGPQDSRTLDFVLSYATKGKHSDIGVASQAIKACYQWRRLDGKMRKQFFNKITGYVGGLYSNMRGGEAKYRATYEQRYNAVKSDALAALKELAGDGTVFTNPQEAQTWWNENKKRKWEEYIGPRFRKRKKAASKGA
ncbi:MAG: hypothetical protein ACYTEZ_01590 [Planctomycetota bacterium]|jgi:hypothetical protein